MIIRLLKYLCIFCLFEHCFISSTAYANTPTPSLHENIQGLVGTTLTFFTAAELAQLAPSQPLVTPPTFSEKQQQWLLNHPRIKVVVVESYLPPAFFDETETFSGPGADMLDKISKLTGLAFDVQVVESTHELAKQVENGSADMIVALHPSREHERSLRFTRSYLDSPFVLVSDTRPGSPNTLDDLAGKRLAIVRDSSLHSSIVKQYPKVNLITVDNPAQALNLVADGDADGAICSLISARHLISHLYPNDLHIQSTIGEIPARIAFAVSRNAETLHSILEKALLAIPPQETHDLSYRWLEHIASEHSKELQKRQLILQLLAVTAALFLIAVAWAFALGRQVRRRAGAEAALEDQLQLMSVLINGTPHPIYVRDREARLLICNDAYLSMLGVERKDVLGKTVVDDLLPDPDQAQACHAMYLHVMKHCETMVSDRVLSTPLGKDLMIFHWVLPYRDNTGAVCGMIGGWIDISERQHLLTQLQAAKVEADNANRAKTAFLATISHEIRTPMNAVIGMLELGMKRFDQGIQDRFPLETASQAAQYLLELISNMLDVASIDSGKLSLSPERANLLRLVDSTLNVFEGLAQEKHLCLSRNLDTGAECDVLIDPLRFKQVLSNVLSNAIKFTNYGAVHLSLSVTNRSDTQHFWVEVLVKDSGIGISREDQQRLFTPFVQATNHAQSPRQGTGLGLSISHTLCAMMGGTLQVQSTLGKGTEVKICLPLQALGLPDSTVTRAAPPWRPLNVLVVDDTSTNRLLLSEQLNYLGHRVTTAADGEIGLAIWRSNVFDLVITDCLMPVMNGYELARAIRRDEHVKQQAACVILGFTANAGREEKDHCLDAGMNDCLLKPLNLNVLEAALSVTGSVTPRAPSTPAAMKTLDLSMLEQLAKGNALITQQFLHELLSQTDEDLLMLDKLMDEGDVHELGQIAHRIKGGMRIVQAHVVIAACEQLEVLCSNDAPIEKLFAQAEILRLAIAQVEHTLTTTQSLGREWERDEQVVETHTPAA